MLEHWKRTSSQTLLSTPRLDVRQDEVINPGGDAHAYDHVVMADTVRVVALDGRGCVLMAEQEHYLPEQRLLQCPGGGVHAGESPMEAAQRELVEETGLLGGQWTSLGTWWPLPALSSCRAHAFLVVDSQSGEAELEAAEADLETAWVPIEEALERTGCAVSAAALAKASTASMQAGAANPRSRVITWPCTYCGEPVLDGDGFLIIDPNEANDYVVEYTTWLAEHPQGVSAAELLKVPSRPHWSVLHEACTERRDGYLVSVERIRNERQLLEWGAHLWEKQWFPYTRWDMVLRTATSERGPL